MFPAGKRGSGKNWKKASFSAGSFQKTSSNLAARIKGEPGDDLSGPDAKLPINGTAKAKLSNLLQRLNELAPLPGEELGKNGEDLESSDKIQQWRSELEKMKSERRFSMKDPSEHDEHDVNGSQGNSDSEVISPKSSTVSILTKSERLLPGVLRKIESKTVIVIEDEIVEPVAEEASLDQDAKILITMEASAQTDQSTSEEISASNPSSDWRSQMQILEERCNQLEAAKSELVQANSSLQNMLLHAETVAAEEYDLKKLKADKETADHIKTLEETAEALVNALKKSNISRFEAERSLSLLTMEFSSLQEYLSTYDEAIQRYAEILRSVEANLEKNVALNTNFLDEKGRLVLLFQKNCEMEKNLRIDSARVETSKAFLSGSMEYVRDIALEMHQQGLDVQEVRDSIAEHQRREEDKFNSRQDKGMPEEECENVSTETELAISEGFSDESEPMSLFSAQGIISLEHHMWTLVNQLETLQTEFHVLKDQLLVSVTETSESGTQMSEGPIQVYIQKLSDLRMEVQESTSSMSKDLQSVVSDMGLIICGFAMKNDEDYCDEFSLCVAEKMSGESNFAEFNRVLNEADAENVIEGEIDESGMILRSDDCGNDVPFAPDDCGNDVPFAPDNPIDLHPDSPYTEEMSQNQPETRESNASVPSLLHASIDAADLNNAVKSFLSILSILTNGGEMHHRLNRVKQTLLQTAVETLEQFLKVGSTGKQHAKLHVTGASPSNKRNAADPSVNNKLNTVISHPAFEQDKLLGKKVHPVKLEHLSLENPQQNILYALDNVYEDEMLKKVGKSRAKVPLHQLQQTPEKERLQMLLSNNSHDAHASPAYWALEENAAARCEYLSKTLECAKIELQQQQSIIRSLSKKRREFEKEAFAKACALFKNRDSDATTTMTSSPAIKRTQGSLSVRDSVGDESRSSARQAIMGTIPSNPRSESLSPLSTENSFPLRPAQTLLPNMQIKPIPAYPGSSNPDNLISHAGAVGLSIDILRRKNEGAIVASLRDSINFEAESQPGTVSSTRFKQMSDFRTVLPPIKSPDLNADKLQDQPSTLMQYDDSLDQANFPNGSPNISDFPGACDNLPLLRSQQRLRNPKIWNSDCYVIDEDATSWLDDHKI